MDSNGDVDSLPQVTMITAPLAGSITGAAAEMNEPYSSVKGPTVIGCRMLKISRKAGGGWR